MEEVCMGRRVRRHSPARVGKGKAKIGKVMHEYKEGTLTSGSGHKVASRDQAIAIAMSEAGMARKKRRRQ